MSEFKSGVKAGVPIGLGYLSVSFAFGIMAVSLGLSAWQAVLISMTCVTSAGQLAGIGIMVFPGQWFEMLLSQMIINIRYSFMSVSLAQKTGEDFKGCKRLFYGFFVTDEIYAVAVSEKELKKNFFSGLVILPYIGWSAGTLIGAVLGGVLPHFVLSALSVMIYAMFIAIVVPDMKGNRAVMLVVCIAVALSVIFWYVPLLKVVPVGLSVSICAVVAAGIGALVNPVKEEM